MHVKIKDYFQELFPLYPMGSSNQFRSSGLHGKDFYPLSHLTIPGKGLFKNQGGNIFWKWKKDHAYLNVAGNLAEF